MDSKINIGQYCHCLDNWASTIGKGKILGVHIIIHGSDGAEGCGGYITDKMLEEHNPTHPKLKQKKIAHKV